MICNEDFKMIVERVREMRRGHCSTLLALTSDMWSENIERFEHLFELDAAEHLASLRQSTIHITGDASRLPQFVSYHGRSEPILHRVLLGTLSNMPFPAWLKSNLSVRLWKSSADLPDRISRGVTEEMAMGGERLFGLRIDDCVYNYDTFRILVEFANMYACRVLTESSPPTSVLDIGGGWGGLIHNFRKFFPDIKCTIADLPETFVFSIPYLMSLHEGDAFNIYNGSDIGSVECLDSDFTFVPPDVLYRVPDSSFDLIVNTGSMAEMTEDQIVEYVSVIKRIGKGTFFSFNEERQSRNSQLESLPDILNAHFDVQLGPYGTPPLIPLICRW